MVRIITDSAADFEPCELEKFGIDCVPMQVTFGDTRYKENVNLDKNQFYKLLEGGVFPKTSQPTPFDFEEIFETYAKKGDECVVVTISSALSGTYQSAFITKENLEYDNCFVVDGLSATAGQRILVEHAVKLRNEGKPAKDIANELEELKGRIKIYACIDTLEYLYKGGRVSKAAYAVGSFANIKPVIYVSREGKVEVCSKALSMKKGIATVCKRFEEFKPDTDYPIYIVYSNKKTNGEHLREAIKSCGYEVPEENLVNIGATIGAHIGSGACGVVFVSK